MKKSYLLSVAVSCIATTAHANFSDSPAAAKAYVKKIDKAVELFMPLLQGADDAEVYRYSREMNSLAQEGKVFGGSYLDLPLGACAVMGSSSLWYWQSLSRLRREEVDTKKLQDIQSYENMYIEGRTACLEAISKLK